MNPLDLFVGFTLPSQHLVAQNLLTLNTGVVSAVYIINIAVVLDAAEGSDEFCLTAGCVVRDDEVAPGLIKQLSDVVVVQADSNSSLVLILIAELTRDLRIHTTDGGVNRSAL